MIAFIILGLMSVLGIAAVYQTLTKYLLIKNTPTQTIRSAAQGFAELSGRAEPMSTIETPISKIPAVAFRLEIYRYVSSGSGKNKSTRRETIIDITHAPRFVLRDDTGAILVDAPRDQNLFTLLRPSYRKEYTLSRGGFFDAITRSFSQSKSIMQTKMLTFEYMKALIAYNKSGDYHVVEDAVRKIIADLDEHLSAFEPAVERQGITWSNNKLFVTEQAIVPNDELLVLGTVKTDGGTSIVTRGKEGTFLIGCGDEGQVLKKFRYPLIGSIIFFLVSLAIFLFLIFGGGSA